jgi:ATP-dependent DNA helicase PIF1
MLITKVIVSGDFFQLPPIQKIGYEKPSYAFAAECWDDLFPRDRMCVLTQVYRQREKGLRELLESVKRGACNEKERKLLRNLDRRVQYVGGAHPVEL